AAAVMFGQHERDLGLEGLAKLCGEELPQLAFRLGEVDYRDDLRPPRRLDEAPKQLLAAVSASSRVQRRPGYSCGLLSHRGPARSRRAYIRPRAQAVDLRKRR